MKESRQTPVVEIAGLEVVRQRQRVLAGVDLEVERGHLHAIVGPNGGGKTTLLLAILGSLRFGGSIRLHWNADGDLGYVPQKIELGSLLPATVEEFMVLAHQRRPLLFGVDAKLRERAVEAMQDLGVAHLARRQLIRLSGGELRRVLVAAALVPEPELLLLDEPASGIDTVAWEAVERRLLKARESGVTILWVSHDLERVRKLADRVTCIERQVRFDGEPREVLTLEGVLSAFSPGPEPGAGEQLSP